MNVFVISLIEERKRREIISQRLSLEGVQFEFVTAVKGSDISSFERLENVDEGACYDRHRRYLTNNEVACFMSHKIAWKKIVESGTSAVVLEDDAFLMPDFAHFLRALNQKSLPVDCVLLGKSKISKRKVEYHYFHNPVFVNNNVAGISIGQPFKYWTSGMVGYWISCVGAKKMLLTNKTISSVSDDWSKHYDAGIVLAECRPYMVYEDNEHVVSSMEEERRRVANYKGFFINCLLEPFRIVRAVIRQIRVRL